MHFVEGSFKTYPVGATQIPAYSAVKTDAAGLLVVATAATDNILGVIHTVGRPGFSVDVRLRSASGTINMKVGGTAVAKDAAVTSNGTGLAVGTTTAGNQIVGYATEAGAAGATIELMPSTAKF